MAHIDVNMNEVEDTSVPHPDGPLLVRVVKGEVRDTKAGDSKYINWQLNPVEGNNKRPIFLMTSLKPEALWNLQRFFKAAQYEWETDGSFNTEDLLGKELFVSVTQEEYNGEMTNRVGPPYKTA